MNKRLLAVLAAMSVAFTLSACGQSTDTKASGGKDDCKPCNCEDQQKKEGDEGDKEEEKKPLPPGFIGIEEKPVGDSGEQKAGMLQVNAVFFQAIDLEQGSMAMPPASESDMHFEVDVKTNDEAKKIGYDGDLFMPYLKINAKIINKDTGAVGYEGTLMPMIANDGPHYGNNIKLPDGKYKVELTIPSPANDWMLHTGKDSSAVEGRFWKDPLKVTFDNWEWSHDLV
ncbi:uncharacterized protein involved in high-affinity Fe2+ transport [Mobiluncus mulieris]|uniref:Pathogen-specific membrane antigen n=1 Tax=Mobiluncus mulieris TaxID=2052 RepID=A0A8G2M5M5_9ACTO|nr:iron transporter [Mobiluncus mulieris]EFN92323.1 hypothetical protein HMPREF9278_1755 [Mobiluncus mulieris FB024-16]MBB5846620.1 uncharacterized protein involved in high-affinity Fe2+ transport [Mobiluncus mulieris]MCV0011774.1 iron transporter [Mobiluncus mulieris]STO16907.1 Pathogen-specific membrane antigen [Mobiluncus mulieris]